MSELEQQHDDVGAYLLGALDDHEREAFEAHVAGCTECGEELERLRPAALALPRSVEPLAAPQGLKRELLDAIREEAEPARISRPRRRLGLSLPRLSPQLAWGAAAVMLAVGVGFGIGKASSGSGTHTITAAVTNPRLARASGTLSVPQDGKQGAILHVSGLPALQHGVYQAWVKRGSEIVPDSTFDIGANGSGAAAVTGDLSGAQQVMVTREPRGGSRAPTEPPILSVRL